MTFTVSVADSVIKFPCDSRETVLAAAQRAGYELPYSCRKGVCGTCKCKLTAGDVRAYAGDTLTEAEKAAGQVLLCQTRPRSDLVIAPREIKKIDPFARRTLTARVFRIARVADDVTFVHLRFPAGIRIHFKAGQNLEVILPDGERRNFSMANPPHESDGVQLHIRHVPNGVFTGYVYDKLARGDLLRVELPFGNFTLQESDKPILFVAGSTGFAPIKSIIEDALRQNNPRPMTLYWGARTRRGLYSELPRKWGALNPRFAYIPVLSDAPEAGFRSGLVHQAVLADHRSLAGFQAYVCGPPVMTTAAKRDFFAAGLPPEQFFVDAFTTRADEVATH
ncbi:MAG TPA: 2Fe-2S iron-sulfur cluster-binding protein [Xanthobacteraceae bacterium]|nr:2Fe-2S iron-sulfur cluster-binding protein [Xanthobacteraceae bacterium]